MLITISKCGAPWNIASIEYRSNCVPIIVCVQLHVLSNYHQHSVLTYGVTVFLNLIPCFCVILPISSSPFSRLSEVLQRRAMYLLSIRLGSELFGECVFLCVSHHNKHKHTLSAKSVFVPFITGLTYCGSHIVYIWYGGLTYCTYTLGTVGLTHCRSSILHLVLWVSHVPTAGWTQSTFLSC